MAWRGLVPLAGVAAALAATGVLAQFSPQDIVANARLQDLMRLCQRQVRDEMRLPPDADINSMEYREPFMECMRDQKAWYPLGR
jgi:hypothetical protein